MPIAQLPTNAQHVHIVKAGKKHIVKSGKKFAGYGHARKKNISGKLFTNFHLRERIPQENFYRRLKNICHFNGCIKTQKNIMIVRLVQY